MITSIKSIAYVQSLEQCDEHQSPDLSSCNRDEIEARKRNFRRRIRRKYQLPLRTIKIPTVCAVDSLLIVPGKGSNRCTFYKYWNLGVAVLVCGPLNIFISSAYLACHFCR